MAAFFKTYLKLFYLLCLVYILSSSTVCAAVINSSSTYIFERENSSWCFSNETTFSFLETGLRAGSNGDLCDAEERGVIEFNIANIQPINKVIDSVTLVLNRQSGNQPLSLHGFQSNGVLETADGNTENILTQSIQILNTPIQIDVSEFIKTQKANSANYVTFMLDNPNISNTDPGGSGTPVVFAARGVSGGPYLNIILLDDSDNDGIPNTIDNCPNTYNPDQKDLDNNNIGDVCENNAPVANAGIDQTVFDSIQLNGNGSYDPENGTLTYSWQIEHRTNFSYNRTASGPRPILQNLQPGFYDVRLTVSDPLGLSDFDTMLFTAVGKAYTEAEFNQMVTDKDAIIASMYTASQYDQAVSAANAIIAQQTQTIDALNMLAVKMYLGDSDLDNDTDSQALKHLSDYYGSNWLTTTFTGNDFQGIWLVIFNKDGSDVSYMEAAAGSILSFGALQTPSPAGTYVVAADGSFTAEILFNDGTNTGNVFVINGYGQLVSTEKGALIADNILSADIKKITDTSTCQGNWVGELIPANGSVTQPFSINVNTRGEIKSMPGFASPVDGRMYCTGGYVASFISTGEPPPFNQIKLNGTVTDNTFTGYYELDNGTEIDGSVVLTR